MLRFRPLAARALVTVAAIYLVAARPESGTGLLLALTVVVGLAMLYAASLLTAAEPPPPARQPVPSRPEAGWVETFYPEMSGRQSFLPVLLDALAAAGVAAPDEMVAETETWAVTLEEEGRAATVGLFSIRRGFVVHVDVGEVEVADLVTAGLDEAAAAVAAWMEERVSVAEWVRRHPAANLRPCVALLDEGRPAYVACRWERLRERGAERGEMRWLLPVLDRARVHPGLARLEPVADPHAFTLRDVLGQLPVRIEADAHGPLGFLALWEDGRLRETDADGAIALLLAELPAATIPEGETRA